MSDIFISYASADRERATLLSKALQRRKWSVWWDRTIPPGKEYDQVIEEALDSAQCVVVLWSRASVASTWVKTEAAEAMRRKILVPALIEDVKIPLEFRRLQAADLSHWRGEFDHPGLEDFFASIDRKIQGSGVIEAAVVPAVPPPVQPRPPTQSARSTRAAWWPAVALIAAAVVVVAGITLWFSQQDEPVSSVPAQQVSAPSQQVSAASSAPVVPEVVDHPEPVRQPPVPDARVADRPVAPTPRREPGRVEEASGAPKPTKPTGGAPVDVKPVTPVPVPESPTPAPAPTAPPEPSPTTRPPNPPAASPVQFEEVVLVVTKDGETQEVETLLQFGAMNLVLKDEDSNIVRTLPYSSIQKATYSRTQRRIMLVRNTRHWLTLGVGREDVVLRLPEEFHLPILSQIEQRTGVAVVRPVE